MKTGHRETLCPQTHVVGDEKINFRSLFFVVYAMFLETPTKRVSARAASATERGSAVTLLEGLPELGVDAVVNAVDNLEVLGEAVGLLLGGDDGDTLEALVVLLNLVGAVVLEALLLEVELNILSVGHVVYSS